jgi:hypothetical protein
MVRLSLLLLAALVLAATALGVSQGGSLPTTAAVRPGGPDWKQVGDTLGVELDQEQGTRSADLPRSDLDVRSQGHSISPGLEITNEFRFEEMSGGRALMIGEMTVTEAEQQAVIDALQRGGIQITAMHKHLRRETPRLWWMHVYALGNAMQTARALRSAVDETATPKPAAEERPGGVDLDRRAIEQHLGGQQEIEDGTLHVSVPRRGRVRDTKAHITLPAPMEVSDVAFFQPIGNRRAIVNGDIVMTAGEIQPVIHALRQSHIQAFSLHNHMLYERPRLFYLHYWATGDGATLARGLRTAFAAANGKLPSTR